MYAPLSNFINRGAFPKFIQGSFVKPNRAHPTFAIACPTTHMPLIDKPTSVPYEPKKSCFFTSVVFIPNSIPFQLELVV